MSPIISPSPNGGSSSFQTGADSPAGTVTPTAIGSLYIDTTHGALYIAYGATSADWAAVGGNSVDAADVAGVITNAAFVQVLANGGAAVITDVGAFAGSGNGIYYGASQGPDGTQIVFFLLGSTGQFTHMFAADGTYANANGIIFPTADPHIAGAWWDNAGTLTKSMG